MAKVGPVNTKTEVICVMRYKKLQLEHKCLELEHFQEFLKTSTCNTSLLIAVFKWEYCFRRAIHHILNYHLQLYSIRNKSPTGLLELPRPDFTGPDKWQQQNSINLLF